MKVGDIAEWFLTQDKTWLVMILDSPKMRASDSTYPSGIAKIVWLTGRFKGEEDYVMLDELKKVS